MNRLDLLEALLDAAKRAGADSADALMGSGTSLSVGRRLGKVEEIERAESDTVGLRVFVGSRSAIVSSGAIDPAGFSRLAEQAVAMARVVPEDRFSTIPDAPPPPDSAPLDMDDPAEPGVEALLARAAAAEEAALAVKGITNSEGAGASWSRSHIALATSRGFAGAYSRSNHGVSVSPIAGEGVGMQRDYEYSAAVHGADLADPAGLGRAAAERAVSRLDPRRPATTKLPVVYHPRVAGSLLGHFAGAINGAAIARGTSFLKDAMGQAIFAPGISIIDDPLRRRGLRSRSFDGEGQTVSRRALIEDGRLTTWLLDSRSAAQLGLATTGHAARGTSGPPSPAPSNLYMQPGALSPEALIADIGLGLYVIELIGMGVNGITGDYSRGAAGFMIRDGQLAEPVAEVTVAGNLREMFLHLTPANDLEFRRGTDAPTLRIEGMTMAGA
ncbi:putative peptidase U62 [Acidiphilium multivorum AIU301]|uniref:Putative peptidase U62 n=1 Tax=Acidiphilium multivorum (strain DSM 11245 / JCM 8867 / NBRC 100883 / AIU 301) TaxID=926570 RepID=F0IZG9_ACIMA|nr:TldD/PmbA family protein [Acidiphilium multivorum]BAJ81179.1 putative peptidase U62 [Acidiphilium multivorum AIU301]GAN74794.1 Zn-dependent microcin-processing peptidase U62/PmbA/TldD [Acidiphilium multivorum AIU301]